VAVTTRLVRFDEKLKQVIDANVKSGLGRFGRHIRNLSILVEDTNGPRDGSGIRCRMVVSLASGRRFSVSAEAGNEYVAVANCASRARTYLDRFLKRSRRLKRRARVLA
jgi:hypothetical protein